jgi:hypothetical protein
MVLADRYIVQDISATYLFLILMFSSYVKFYICMFGWHVSHLHEIIVPAGVYKFGELLWFPAMIK